MMKLIEDNVSSDFYSCLLDGVEDAAIAIQKKDVKLDEIMIAVFETTMSIILTQAGFRKDGSVETLIEDLKTWKFNEEIKEIVRLRLNRKIINEMD